MDVNLNIDTKWQDIVEIIEAKKNQIQIYAEAESIEKLTAFEEFIKDLERDDF